MASLLRMSDQELAKHVAGRGLRAYGAAGMATAATVLAFLGMASRQAQGDSALLPGSESTAGQLGWAIGLGLMMLAAAWLARNVIMKRLQAAIVVSLLLHLLACVAFQQWSVGSPIATVVAASEGEPSPLSDLTLPDYGGMESIDAPTPEWEQATDSPVSDARLEEMERQLNEAEVSLEQERVEIERQEQAAQLEEMQRQEVEVRQREAAAELQRQMNREQELQAESAQAESAPEVTTDAAAEAELQAQAEAQRSENSLEVTERERTEIETSNDPRVNAERVESQRSEMTPEQQSFRAAARQATVAEATAAAAEAVEVSTAEAAQASAREREMEAARQAESSLSPQRMTTENSPRSDRQVRVDRVAPERQAVSDRSLNSFAPASGGAASQSRSTTSASSAASSSSAAAQSVEVAAAGGATAPALTAATSAAAASRGTSAGVPVSAAAGGSSAPSGTGAQVGVSALGSSAIGRQSSGSNGRPRLGDAVSSPLAGGAGRAAQPSRSASGVGASAGTVQVASAAASRASGNTVLSTGPSGGAVQRSSGSLTGRTLRGGGTSSTAPGSSGRSVSVSAGGSSGLQGRGSTEPSARLGQNAGLSAEGESRLPSTRRTASASLPAGAIAAEQAGQLVMAGPQAPSTGAGSSRSPIGGGNLTGTGGLSGPRTTGLGRKTASLPGMSRSSGIGRTRSSLPLSISGGGSGLSRSRVTGSSRPSLASTSDIEGLVRRSARDIGAVESGQISAGFSMRRADVRGDAVRSLGGSDASERAVERGLQWLSNHQFAAGNWSIHELNCQDHECLGHGSFQADTAATGLSLLAFLGAGHSHRSGEHQDVVGRGLKWLVDRQKASGDLFTDEAQFVWMYSHGMAAIALCEAYGMTKDSALREPAQRSLDFIVAAQHPEFGGWRYRPQFESDTSVSGWQLMALKSGQMAGLNVPESAYKGISRWLDSVENKGARGRFAYHPSKAESLAMTAEGLLMRQYLGAWRDDPALISGAGYLKQRLPRLEERDAYYWYYATQVMFHMQGEYWSDWNSQLRDLLVDSQVKGGGAVGSWSPATPSKSKWGEAGGRHYQTCLSLLMLEVYYRHLPLYIELQN